MTRTLLAMAAAAAFILLSVSPASADPYYCVVVHDQNGNTMNTTCVPWPGH